MGRAVAAVVLAVLILLTVEASPQVGVTATTQTVIPHGAFPAAVIGVFSPDGSQLSLRLVPLNGGPPVALPGATPGGTIMAVQGTTAIVAETTSGLEVVDLETGTRRTIVVGQGYLFAPLGTFSPDGTQFAFGVKPSATAPPQLDVLDVRSGQIRQVPLPAGVPALAAGWDASGIDTVDDTGVYIIDPADGALVGRIPMPANALGFNFLSDAAVAVSEHTTGLGDDAVTVKNRPVANTVMLVRSGGTPSKLRVASGHNMSVMAVGGDGSAVIDDEPASDASPHKDLYGCLLVHPDGTIVPLFPFAPPARVLAAVFSPAGDVVYLVQTPPAGGTTGSQQRLPDYTVAILRAGSKKPVVLDAGKPPLVFGLGIAAG